MVELSDLLNTKFGKRGLLTASGAALILGTCAYFGHRFGLPLVSDYLDYREKGSPSMPGKYHDKIGIDIVASLEGQKEILRDIIGDDDVINITIAVNAERVPELASKAIGLRYFMLNGKDLESITQQSHFGHWRIKRNLISLGGRDDLVLNENGEGSIEGFFEYAVDAKENFIDGTPFINPHSSHSILSRNNFYFLVQVVDENGVHLESKWWGQTPENPSIIYSMNFDFPKLEEITSAAPRREKTAGEPRIFVYKQAIARERFDNELANVMDVFQPHLYEINASIEKKTAGNGKNRKQVEVKNFNIKQRVGDGTARKIKESAMKHGYRVLPMFSAFSESTINNILNNPEYFAQKIKEEVDKYKWDGALIDLESARLNGRDSQRLNNFISILREYMPQQTYKIGIAVSPRFEGSDKEGYPHHGFYDYRTLSGAVDYVQIMAYDFHKGRRISTPSPILPEDKIQPIMEYARRNVDDMDKIVVLMPLYGFVWREKEVRTGRGRNRRTRTVIVPVGTLSAASNDKFLNAKGRQAYIENGELRIDAGNTTVYTQTGDVYRIRHQELKQQGLRNFGYWRQEHASPDIIREIIRL